MIKVRVGVTRDHIWNGVREVGALCPIAMATKETIREMGFDVIVAVFPTEFDVNRSGTRVLNRSIGVNEFKFGPHVGAVQGFIEVFDRDGPSAVNPFSFWFWWGAMLSLELNENVLRAENALIAAINDAIGTETVVAKQIEPYVFQLSNDKKVALRLCDIERVRDHLEKKSDYPISFYAEIKDE